MLFSEPKIPQLRRRCAGLTSTRVSVLFSEPKIPHEVGAQARAVDTPRVSVLFSEPKIPHNGQSLVYGDTLAAFQCSSASRKFLTAKRLTRRPARAAAFQCSSASRKFLTRRSLHASASATRFQCSSASRKFLTARLSKERYGYVARFQCSSASRKFLTVDWARGVRGVPAGFSALQRAENSSTQLARRVASVGE